MINLSTDNYKQELVFKAYVGERDLQQVWMVF